MPIDDDTRLGDLDADRDDDGSLDGGNHDDLEDATIAPETLVLDASVACTNCAHQDVCAVFGNFRQQVSEEIPGRTGGEPAFDPADLAIICDHYLDASAAEEVQ